MRFSEPPRLVSTTSSGQSQSTPRILPYRGCDFRGRGQADAYVETILTCVLEVTVLRAGAFSHCRHHRGTCLIEDKNGEERQLIKHHSLAGPILLPQHLETNDMVGTTKARVAPETNSGGIKAALLFLAQSKGIRCAEHCQQVPVTWSDNIDNPCCYLQWQDAGDRGREPERLQFVKATN